jgi:hypothetical protein
LPIILLFTDAPMHNGPPDGTTDPYNLPDVPNWLDSISVLNDIGAKVLGFYSGGDWDISGLENLNETAIATGTVYPSGEPLVWSLGSDGSGLSDAVVDAIEDLSTQVARDVSTTVEESPLIDDGVDAADFIKSVLPVRGTPDAPAGYGRHDEETFFGVNAGTVLTFGVTFQNDFVEEELEPQVFVARIVVLGDNTVRLDDRRVIILIPPAGVVIQ